MNKVYTVYKEWQISESFSMDHEQYVHAQIKQGTSAKLLLNEKGYLAFSNTTQLH